MKLVEFYVWICRICFEHFRNTPYENEMMYLKIEKLLPIILYAYHLTPVFLFNEEFEYKPMVKKNKRKVKVVKKKVNSSSDDSSESSQSEQDEEESSSEDDLGECVVLEEGKFKLSQGFIQKMQRERKEKAERREQREIDRAKKAAEKEADEKKNGKKRKIKF